MEDIKEKKIKIARSRKGIPCLWESLTVFEDLKRATIIFSADKKPKDSLYYNVESTKQALVPIKVGDYVSKAFEDKYGVALSVFKVTEISSMDNTAVMVPVFRKSSQISAWTNPEEYSEMINLACKKLTEDRFVVSREISRTPETTI
jgi:hypothetical protein